MIVVTGKGIHSQNEKDPYVSKDLSILKYSIPEFISNNKNLMKIIYEMKDAKIEDGGSGAFYIFLKKNKLNKSLLLRYYHLDFMLKFCEWDILENDLYFLQKWYYSLVISILNILLFRIFKKRNYGFLFFDYLLI